MIAGTEGFGRRGVRVSRGDGAGPAKGEIIIMGMDRDDTMLKYIKDGWMQATAVQRNFTEFYIDVFYLQSHHQAALEEGGVPD